MILCCVQSLKIDGSVFDAISVCLPTQPHSYTNNLRFDMNRFRRILIQLFATTLLYGRGETHVDAYGYGGQIWKIPETSSTSDGHCFLRDWGLHVANSTAPIRPLVQSQAQYHSIRIFRSRCSRFDESGFVFVQVV